MSDDQIEEKVEEQVDVEQTPIAQEQAQEQVEEASVSPKELPKRKDAEYNFAELRKQKEASDRRAEDAERRANDILEFSKQFKAAQTPQERDLVEEELSKLSPDDLATINHVDKKIDRYSKRGSKEVEDLKKQVAELKATQEEIRFRAKFPDLDEVISQENIEMLNKEEPEIAEVISKMPKNSREQVTMAYKYIKRMLPTKHEDNGDKKRAVENSKKPLSVQAVAKSSPMGMASAFEDRSMNKEKAKQYFQEMQDAIKRG